MFFFLNGSEFRQKLIGTIIGVLRVVHSPASNIDKDPMSLFSVISEPNVGEGVSTINYLSL